MSLGIMQRFSSEYILRLKQIGLAFFEKIATDKTIAGETQDFYQGLLVGFERAVKLIDEEDGVRTLSLLEAKIATFIDVRSDSFQQSSSSEPPLDYSRPFICRLSSSYISQLRKIGMETCLEPDVKNWVSPVETQDFYHGCIAALDFAISLAGEKYAYARISLLKTNVANFIDLNKDREHQVHVLGMKGLPSLKRKNLYQKSGLFGALVQANNEAQVGTFVEDNIDSLFTQEESFDSEALEQEDSTSEDSSSDDLTAPLASSNPVVLKYHNGDGEGAERILDLLRSDVDINFIDSVPSVVTIDIQQMKLAELILPTAQRAFEYVLNYAPALVEETDEYTRVRLGDLYDLIVRDSKGVSVSSLTACGRGELIKVRGEDVVLAQGILSEDVEFWFVVAEQLDRIDAMRSERNILANDGIDVDKPNDIEI